MKYDLSILIPGRNEEFFAKTIEDILEHIEGETEIIAVLDGVWQDLPKHERVSVIFNPVSVGQRAATNQAANIAQGEYIMKVDAHCSFDQGFDVKMLKDMQENWTMVPTMRNLHAFDWVCEDGHRRDQGPSGPCLICNKPTVKDIVWEPRAGTRNTSYCFDSEPHFQYFQEFKSRPEGKEKIAPSMSIQGSCFMMSRKKYFELDASGEEFGSWGSQGIEVACKTWLSGGEVMISKHTWYAHMFRTQGGDFGFPYEQSGKQIGGAKKHARELFFDNRWHKQTKPLSWLLEKFWPVPGWSQEDFDKIKAWPLQTRGILYYTDNLLEPKLMKQCQEQIKKPGLPITSVSLRPIDFGNNITLPLERGYLTMAKQILAGLEAMDTEVVFFCEHDVLYHPSHFEFCPIKNDTYYYNVNAWKLRSDGFAVKVDDCRQLSALCAKRSLLIEHFRERVRRIESEGFSRKMGFEPGTHNRKERIDDFKSDIWNSKLPIIDIRHDTNLTSSRWKKEQFRDQRFTKGWTESYTIPGWGKIEDIIK